MATTETRLHAGYNPAIEGLRGVAILLVLAFHYERVFLGRSVVQFHWGGRTFTPLANGYIGVDLFFVLSGFLVTHNLLLARLAGNFSLKRYLAKRALRIMPAYVVVMFCIFFFAFYGENQSVWDLLELMLIHALCLQDYFGGGLHQTTWSLGVEEKFYLFAPLLVFSLAHLRLKYVVPICFILSSFSLIIRTAMVDIPFRNIMPMDAILRYPFHCNLECLLTGACIAFVLPQHHEERQGKHMARDVFLPLACLFLCTALLIAMSLMSGTPAAWFWRYIPQPALLSVTFGLLVFCVAQRKHWLSRACAALPLRYFGKLSYSLYLVDFISIVFARTLADEYIAVFFPSLGDASFLVFLAYVLLQLSLASLLHYSVEAPFLRMKARI